MTPAQTWFIVLPHGEEGPLDAAAVRARVSDGRIGPATLLRRGDLAQPVLASRIRGLLPAMDEVATTATPRPGHHASASPTGSSRSGRVSTQVLTVLPAGSDPEPVTPGRAVGRPRWLGVGIDAAVAGLVLIPLLVLGSLRLLGDGDGARADIERLRQEQSAAAVAQGGDQRPSLAEWPTVEPQWVAAIAAKRQALAAKPSEEETRRLKAELEYQEKRLAFERTAHARDLERIRQATEDGRPLGAALMMIALLVAAVILPLMELLAGGTPGKLCLGLRTVGPRRHPLTPGQAFRRHLGRCIPGIHLSMLDREDGRSWHEAWSRTEVVTADQVRPISHLRTITASTNRPRRRVA